MRLREGQAVLIGGRSEQSRKRSRFGSCEGIQRSLCIQAVGVQPLGERLPHYVALPSRRTALRANWNTMPAHSTASRAYLIPICFGMEL